MMHVVLRQLIIVLRQLIIALFEEEGVARERQFKDACWAGESPGRKKKLH